MSGNDETRQLILDTAGKIFSDNCDKPLLDRAETGEFPQALWDLVQQNGFDQLGTAASGTSADDLFAFVQVCGRHAVPLPLSETLIVNRWLESGALSSFGEVVDDQIVGVPWGRQVDRVVGISAQSNEIEVIRPPQSR